ncbi:preprotein translocase subunit SecY [Oscillospiraceae bacterium MB08-C2-2]|nr:preprotein translocase subunit SecY [Oscillospiraceae bacterium MB08-C2-2]
MLETIRNAWKIADLRSKILYTLMILMVYRIGSAIPVPFLDASVLQTMMSQAGGGLLGYVDILTGGAFANATLFAMGISPYITSSIVVQLLAVAIPYLEQLSKEGEAGRKKMNLITRWVTLGLALIQSFAYYMLNRRPTNTGAVAVKYLDGFPGVFSALVIILTFTAGSMMVVWLGEQIDHKGIGNGISIILFAGIISRGPSIVLKMAAYIGLANEGQTQYYVLVPLIVVMFVVMIGLIILMTTAERRIPVQYAKRVVGRKFYGGQSSHIPVKVTMSGVMPIIFASALLSIPGLIQGFVDPYNERWIGKVLSLFNYNTIWYALLYLLLIIAFNYFYVSIQYNPIEMANNLRKNNGAIPGIRPGRPTSDFIARVISKITLVGALFIAGVAILPIILGNVFKINIALGGTSIIIVVGVALDTVRTLESQMMMRHYKGFLE